MKGIRAKVDYILKHNMLINRMFKICGSLFFRFVGLFIRMDEKAILFSGHSRKYNDSPRAIYEYMISRPEYAGYRYIWALDDLTEEIPGPAAKVKSDTWSYFVIALRCKYWVACVNIERSLKFKRKKNVYLNTWHGIPFKTIGNEAAGRKDYDFSYIDYFCISGDYEMDLYQRSFNVRPESLLKVGMPRNDVLYCAENEEILKIKAQMKLPPEKKVILYAPTWRDSTDGGKSYQIKPPMDLVHWEELIGEDYVLLFRTHPYTNKILGVNFNEFVRDFTDYPNINDLLKVSDILISDYSATIFDYAILERPIICFAYDLEQYSKVRGFALDIKSEMPGGVVATEDEVIQKILFCNYSKEAECVKRFKEKYIKHGGCATELCVDALLGGTAKADACKG